MAWGAPQFLWLLIVPLLALWCVRLRARNSGDSALIRVSVVGSQVQAMLAGPGRRPWLFALAVLFGVLALARPKWGAFERPAVEPAREVMIALDLSRSMRVEDVAPSRLERAHTVVRSLLGALDGERVGLIVFAGTGFLQVPLSSDYQILREFLPELDPSYLPQGGTDYAGMLRAANDGFSQDPEVDRTLFVLSDGESTTEGWREELARLKTRGVNIVALGIGSEKGGEVPSWDGGPSAFSKLEPATLRALAAGPGGIYRDASAPFDTAALLAESVELGRQVRETEREALDEEERYQWFLAVAIGFGLAGLWRELRVRPRARVIQRDGSVSAAASADSPRSRSLAAAAALVAVAGAMLSSFDARAHLDDPEYNAEATAGDQLQWLAHHLAWHPTLQIDDLRLLAELTINYGVQTFSRGDALEEGALRDAIEAVDIGMRRDPSFTDWEELRAELTRLSRRMAETTSTRPPEEPKEARDEEDNPPQTNGQGAQQTAADSIGMGGIATTDATLGELRRDTGPLQGPRPTPTRVRTAPGTIEGSDTVRSDDPIRAILMRRYDQVTKEDSPGTLHRNMQGEVTAGPAGGRNW